MILGHAAGVAAAMAIRGGLAVQDVDTAQLTKSLVSQGAVLEYVPSPVPGVLNRIRTKR